MKRIFRALHTMLGWAIGLAIAACIASLVIAFIVPLTIIFFGMLALGLVIFLLFTAGVFT